MPFKSIFNITPKINKILMEIERVRGFLEAVKLKDDWIAEKRGQVNYVLFLHITTDAEIYRTVE